MKESIVFSLINSFKLTLPRSYEQQQLIIQIIKAINISVYWCNFLLVFLLDMLKKILF